MPGGLRQHVGIAGTRRQSLTGTAPVTTDRAARPGPGVSALRARGALQTLVDRLLSERLGHVDVLRLRNTRCGRLIARVQTQVITSSDTVNFKEIAIVNSAVDPNGILDWDAVFHNPSIWKQIVDVLIFAQRR
jgi:hypothetical protein